MKKLLKKIDDQIVKATGEVELIISRLFGLLGLLLFLLIFSLIFKPGFVPIWIKIILAIPVLVLLVSALLLIRGASIDWLKYWFKVFSARAQAVFLAIKRKLQRNAPKS